MKSIFLRLFVCLLILSPAMSVRAEEHEAKPKAEKAEKAEGGGEHGEKPALDKDGKPIEDNTPGPRYVPMAPMVLPVIGDNGPSQLITLLITLEVDNKDDIDKIKQNMPRLTDAYMQKLYGAIDRRMVTRGTLVDVDLVKKQLVAPTTKVLGPDIVKNILVQAVAQRRL